MRQMRRCGEEEMREKEQEEDEAGEDQYSKQGNGRPFMAFTPPAFIRRCSFRDELTVWSELCARNAEARRTTRYQELHASTAVPLARFRGRSLTESQETICSIAWSEASPFHLFSDFM